jgi:hypothetical protein
MNVYISMIISIVTMFVTVFVTNKRIESDDSEQHKPYLVLDNITSNSKLDVYKYYLTFIGRNYHR